MHEDFWAKFKMRSPTAGASAIANHVLHCSQDPEKWRSRLQ
ncbi:hypothetical protein [Nostoc sp.]